MNALNKTGYVLSNAGISDYSRISEDKILKSQVQMKTSMEESVLSTITKVMEHSRHEDLRKKDKSALHMKELRRDLRHLYSELDGKNDLIHVKFALT